MTEVVEVKEATRSDGGRDKKSLNLSKELNSPNRPSSPYFRTRSPTVQPAATPYLGFVSPYAYMASLAATPPGSKTSKIKADSRSRAISEPPPTIIASHTPSPTHARSEPPSDTTSHTPNLPNGHTSKLTTPTSTTVLVDAHFHAPVPRPYESRTPKLVRGVAKKTMAVYMQDLDEAKDMVTTVVLGGSPSSPATVVTVTGNHALSAPEGGGRKNFTIIPSESPRRGRIEEEEQGGDGKKETKKKISIIKSVRTGDKSKPPPASPSSSPARKKDASSPAKKKEKKEKKMTGSGRLSKLSLPNLYKPATPTSPAPQSISDVTLESTNAEKSSSSFFRRNSKKQSGGGHLSSDTGWSFQPAAVPEAIKVGVSETGGENMQHSRSELYLSAVSEPRPLQSPKTRAASMFNLFESEEVELEELDPPVTMFSSHSMEDVLEDEGEEQGEEFGGLSLGSIKIEMKESETGGTRTENSEMRNSDMGTKNPDTGTKNPDMGTKNPDTGTKNSDTGTSLTSDPDATRALSNNKEEKSVTVTVVKENIKDENRKLEEKVEVGGGEGKREASTDTTASLLSVDEPIPLSSHSNEQQQFKRFTTSRKPLRKPSFGGKESPRQTPKRSPSSVSANTITETPPTSPRFVKRSPVPGPSRSPVVSSSKFERSFRGGGAPSSPLTTRKTTPTSSRRSLESSPRGSLKSPRTTPTSDRKLSSPAKRPSPMSSPVVARKSLGPAPSGKGRSSLTSSSSSSPKPKKSDASSDNKATPTAIGSKVAPSKTTPTSARKSKTETIASIEQLTFEPSNTTSEKTTPSSSGSTTPTTPTTPNSRRRKTGVSSVTSPLVEEVGFGNSLLVKPASSRKSSTDSTRLSSSSSQSPLTSPRSSVRATPTAAAGSFGKSGVTRKAEPGGAKSQAPPTTHQSKSITTYVYKSPKAGPDEAPPPASPKTYKYTSGGRRKDSNKNSKSSQTTTSSETSLSPTSSYNTTSLTDITKSSSSITSVESSSISASSSLPSTETSRNDVSTTTLSTSTSSVTSVSSVACTTSSSATNFSKSPSSPVMSSKSTGVLPVKTVLSPTSKKPPSGAKSSLSKCSPVRVATPSLARKASGSKTTPTSPSRSKSEEKMELGSSKVLKSSVSTGKVGEKRVEEDTAAILNPLTSLITCASPPSSEVPLSPPSLLGALQARPLSPTSPLHSEADDSEFLLGAVLSPPEIPIWSDIDSKRTGNDEASQLTYIYRSTLLRKSSRPTNQVDGGVTKATRVPSNKSPHHEGAKTLTRTTSPRKISLPVPASQVGGASSTLRKSSIANRGSVKRKSVSRASANKTVVVGGAGGGANRPRSASLAPHPDSLVTDNKGAKSKNSTGGLVTGGGERDSIRKSKKSVSSTRPASAKPKTATSKSASQLQSSAPTKDELTTPTVGSKATPTRSVSSSRSPLIKAKTADSSTKEAAPQEKNPPIVKTTSTTVYLSRSSEGRSSIKKTSSKPPIPLSASVGSTGSSLLRSSIKRGSKTSGDSDKHRSSLRLSRRSSAGTITKGGSNRGTLKRAGNVGGSPAHTSSPSSTSRGHSVERDETLSVFDDISSMAQKNLLSSASDHKRAVRPRERQKPSSSHLQLLSKRSDISSDMDTPTSGATPKADPNAYSTYMGKKVLDHSALLGLAAKLDFTTVKLRKTGIVEQMMSDKEGGRAKGGDRVSDVSDISANNYGVKTTSHPLILLIIKGRKSVQTRLVQPVASSVNSGDVFVLIRDNDLFLWSGKDANVIEKARGNDLVHRIQQRKELGCHSNGFVSIEDNGEKLTKKQKLFWEILNGKNPVNKDSLPPDEVYERGVNLSTKIYQYTQDGSGETPGKYTMIHEDVPTMPKIALLDSKKILLFDFYSEVYVWIGKKSPPSHRKPAMMKARKVFDGQCVPPSFKPVTGGGGGGKGGKGASTGSPVHKLSVSGGGIRSSGRFSGKSQRHGTLNSSTRRKSLKERRPSKGDLQSRPDWSLFSRVNEGSESILFREKFSDWPEPGRIIKMKGHESSGEVVKPPPMPELQPADVSVMLQNSYKFEGLRLDGENIHRGRGNYQVSRSTFACNRVRSQKVEKYRVKESDSVLINEQDNHLFYSGEGYIIRWSYVITVVRELEGLTPGKGMFAMDRQYQKTKSKSPSPPENDKRKDKGGTADDCSSDEDVIESDEECQRVLESGGRDRCAYFFWQGHHASINEKGATAIMTVELDKEKGPQVRVVQGTEHPAFLQLFNGSMIVLHGKSDNNDISLCNNGYRLYYCGGFAKKEAYLLEINTNGVSLSFCLRSRGCFVIQDSSSRSVIAWVGRQTTDKYRQIVRYAAKKLKKKLGYTVLLQTQEGEECPQMKSLLNDRLDHYPITTPVSYTPRLFHLSSSTGWFRAIEETHIACPEDMSLVPDHFPFIQETVYNAVQPAVFLIDAHSVIYLWFGWWPEQKNALLREKNAFSGTAFSRWAQEKKLSLQTALNYAKESGRSPLPSVFIVSAGSEDLEFINLFPYWRDNNDVTRINNTQTGGGCVSNTIIRTRRSGEEELAKYTRTSYSLEELKKRPEELNPNKLETYLSEEDFQDIFKMSKEQFSLLPNWKQVNHKKSIGLF